MRSSIKFGFLTLFAFMGCNRLPTELDSQINTEHLEHLFEKINVEDIDMGVIWIYCEAPDYVLTTDDDEGFTCVDDVARSLVFYLKRYQLLPEDHLIEKITLLTEYILHMQADNGLFYNFMLPDKTINTEHTNSQLRPDWWAWRAFWALSEVMLLDSRTLGSLQTKCRKAIDKLLPYVRDFCADDITFSELDGLEIPSCFTLTGADQAAIVLLALANYYQINPTAEIRNVMMNLGTLLLAMQYGGADQFPYSSFFSWKNYWHAWGNSQAYALLKAGQVIDEPKFIAAGLDEVRFFYPYCLKEGFFNEFKVVRTDDQYSSENLKLFPQIAYGLRPMIFASLEAYAITGDSTFASTAGRLATWFFGNNPANRQMYDPTTGRTFDGIGSPADVNLNSGAESTIEGLLSIQAVESNEISNQILIDYRRRYE